MLLPSFFPFSISHRTIALATVIEEKSLENMIYIAVKRIVFINKKNDPNKRLGSIISWPYCIVSYLT